MNPGNSATELVIQGNSVFGFSNTLEIQIGGLIPGTEFDVVDVGGSQVLGGTLEIVLIEGFQPTAGNEFRFLTAAGGITGGFNSVLLPEMFELTIGVLQTGGHFAAMTVVPLPAPLLLLGSALAALVTIRRRPTPRRRGCTRATDSCRPVLF